MRGLGGLLAAACVGLGPNQAMSCNVPVFRYALERWEAEPFVVTVFHRGPLQESNTVIRAMREAAANELVNLHLSTVDLDGEVGEGARKLWASQTNATLPWMVAQFPSAHWVDMRPGQRREGVRERQFDDRFASDEPVAPVLWAGPPNRADVTALVDSPARREIVRRLQEGISAVWVLAESGRAKADEAARQLLETELVQVEKTLQVPAVDPDDPRTAINTNLSIRFAVVRIKPDEENERMFLKMLRSGSPVTSDTAGPTVFPVFGRGRVLGALAGEDLTAAMIRGAAEFLCGPCSCEVKEQNPGWDVIMAADWWDLIGNPVVRDPGLPDLISLSALARQPVAAAPDPLPAGARTAVEPEPSGRLARNTVVALVVVGVIVLAGTLGVILGTRAGGGRQTRGKRRQ